MKSRREKLMSSFYHLEELLKLRTLIHSAIFSLKKKKKMERMKSLKGKQRNKT